MSNIYENTKRTFGMGFAEDHESLIIKPLRSLCSNQIGKNRLWQKKNKRFLIYSDMTSHPQLKVLSFVFT